jgi:hypothetical protein
MKVILGILIIFIQLSSLQAQDLEKQTCYDNLMMTDDYGDYLIDVHTPVTNIISGMTAISGVILAVISSPLVLVASAVEGANMSYLLSKKMPINWLRSIIYFSLKKVSSPDTESSKLLKRTVEKINEKSTNQITELEFAKMIVQANEERKLCSCDRLTSLREIKKEIIRNGDIKDVVQNYKVPSLRKNKLY